MKGNLKLKLKNQLFKPVIVKDELTKTSSRRSARRLATKSATGEQFFKLDQCPIH